MRSILATIVYCWQTIWFQDRTTEPVEIVRIILGATLFFGYGVTSPSDVQLFYGFSQGMFSKSLVETYDSYGWSLFFYLDAPWMVLSVHYFFAFCFFALTIGWQTVYFKWLALLAHLSYFNANPMITYGADQISASILLLLCFASIGRALSVDSMLQRWHQKSIHGLNATYQATASPWTFACQRLIQIQMAVLFFYAGVSKIKVAVWQQGDGLWYSLFDIESAYHLLSLLAEHYWLSYLASHFTVALEISYAFLIWPLVTRKYFLAAAILFHLAIGCIMGLLFFAFVMIAGHMAFLCHAWLARAAQLWQARFAGMVMLYDGNCGFCKRSMAWFLAFDGLQLIKAKNLYQHQNQHFTQEQALQALVLIKPDGSAVTGYYAYRYAVSRTPGLWWLLPGFCLPFVSSFIGTRLYHTIAKNRARL